MSIGLPTAAPRGTGPGALGPDDGRGVFTAASARLRRAVPFDAAGWFAVDPATLLPTSPVLIENIEPGGCGDYWYREITVEDVLLFRDLARSPRSTASLLATTAGNPARSARYRDYLEPHHFTDEMRTVLRVDDGVWGVAALLRGRGRPAFSTREVERVAGAGPEIADALASLAVARRPGAGGVPADCTGTAVFGRRGVLSSVDEQATRWFTELAGPRWIDSDELRTALAALVARADMVAVGRETGPVAVRVRTPLGRWLVVSASRQLPLADGSSTTVVVGAATSQQVAPILLDAHGLTPRERDVTRAVARGLSNAEIARDLFLSIHTVRDHLKAVFDKLDVTTRGELVARLFADQSAPMLEAAGSHVSW